MRAWVLGLLVAMLLPGRAAAEVVEFEPPALPLPARFETEVVLDIVDARSRGGEPVDARVIGIDRRFNWAALVFWGWLGRRAEILRFDRTVADVVGRTLAVGLRAGEVWPHLPGSTAAAPGATVLSARVLRFWCTEPGDDDEECRASLELEMSTGDETAWSGVVEVMSRGAERGTEGAFIELLERVAEQVRDIAVQHRLAEKARALPSRGTTFAVTRGADRDLVTLPGSAPGDPWVGVSDGRTVRYYRPDGTVGGRLLLIGAGERLLLMRASEGAIVSRGTVPGPDGKVFDGMPAGWMLLWDRDGRRLGVGELRRDYSATRGDAKLHRGRFEATVDGEALPIPVFLERTGSTSLRAFHDAQLGEADRLYGITRANGIGAAALGGIGGGVAITGALLRSDPDHATGGTAMLGWGTSFVITGGLVALIGGVHAAKGKRIRDRMRGENLEHLEDDDGVWRATDAANRRGR